MDDLISRAALLKSLNEQAPNLTTDDLYTVNMCIINAPAVDAVQVVRCKDCRFAKVENNYGFDEVICYNKEFGPRCPVPLDWFCGDGDGGKANEVD